MMLRLFFLYVTEGGRTSIVARLGQISRSTCQHLAAACRIQCCQSSREIGPNLATLRTSLRWARQRGEAVPGGGRS
ncbi:unnamed protein product [Boreogadus saida]